MTPKQFVLCVATAAMATTVMADPLRYHIKPSQVVPYRVTITVKTPSAIETMKGVIVFTGKKANDDTMTVVYSGGLSKSSKSTVRSTGRGRFGGPPRMGGPGGPRGPFDSTPFRGLVTTKNTLIMSPLGTVKSMSGDSQLPYILGNLAILPFEALPDREVKEWEDANGFSITTTSSNDRFGPRRPPFLDNNQDKIKGGGGEKSTYKITEDTNGMVTIAKTYNMTSPKANADETGYKMEGAGTWVFNRELGVSESIDYKIDFNIDTGNVTLTYPITIKTVRLTDEAYAAHVKKIADDRAALTARLKEQAKARAAREAAKPKGPTPPKAMSSSTRFHTMSRLKTPVWQSVRTELAKLATSKMTGVVPEDMDMLTQVGILRSSKHIEVSVLAEKVWSKWKHSFEEHASDAQRAAVAKAMGEEPAAKKMDEDNPFVEEKEEDEDDGKGQRTWADATGRFKIEAEFESLDGITVVLIKPDGKKMRIAKERLSKDDQKLIDKLTKEPATK